MKTLAIKYKDPRKSKPRLKNPRTHTNRQVKQIAASIQEFGFINPVMLDGSDGIVAGHARAAAAISIGMTDVPTVCVDHLSPAQIRAYVIADHRLAEKAGWDRELLALELQELSVEPNFDVTVTGFDTAEIDIIIGGAIEAGIDDADEVPEIDRSTPPVSRVGDCWRIGAHFLLCGDALKEVSYERLLRGKRAQMVFTDPPYNVQIAGNVSGLGKVKHREFAMASGEMTRSRDQTKAVAALGAFTIRHNPLEIQFRLERATISPASFRISTITAPDALLGAIGARAGGANVLRATVRVTFWGALALGITAGIGKLFGTVV